MRKLFLILAFMGLMTSCGDGFDKKDSAKNPPQQNAQEVDTFGVNQDYLQLVNDHRIEMQLRPLTYHSIVEEIAKSHSKAMAGYVRPFGHIGFTVRCRRLKNRIGKIKLCGELVAMGQKNIQAVFKAWMNEPKHREEIERPSFTHTGLGIYKDARGVRYWTQMLVEQ
jgi:uncharacterized protein YkwD